MSSPGNTPSDDAPAPRVSPVDLDYELIRMIGRGGYGEVWLVRDRDGFYRAGKVVHRESFEQERPYEREYEGICKFEPVSRGSESQVRILHVGRRDAAGCFYYIMELADDVHHGQAIQPDTYEPRTLRGEMELRGRLTAGECIDIGISLSAALQNLHEHGLIHRDVKPANIIFVNNTPKLADIGLVTDADVTVSYVGTSGFIPPEGPSSPQADVYALGKVLYEISTGLDRLEYPELPSNFGELPDRELLLELNAIIAQACEADPRKRHISAAALHEELVLLKNGGSVRRVKTAKRTRALAAKAAAAAGLLFLIPFVLLHWPRERTDNPPTRDSRTPVPEASRLAQAETRVRDSYKAQLSGGTGAARQFAAAELLKQSATTEDPALQLADLRVAGQLAAQAADCSLIIQICDAMMTRFQTNKLAAEADLLTQAEEYSRGPGKDAEMAGICQMAGFEALAADDYDSGLKLAELAKVAAQKSNAAKRIKEAEFLDSELNRCQIAFDSVRPFENILRSQPFDPQACLAVGKFLCFVKEDWDAGLPMLAHSTNSALKPIVTTELNHRPALAGGQIALGRAWRDLAANADAGDRSYYLARARYWYLKGLASSPAKDRERLRQQMSDVFEAVPTVPAELHISSHIIGTVNVDIYSDEIRWISGRIAANSRINHVKLDDLKLGDVTIIKNCGISRVMPDNVDFSTAILVVNHKPKKQASARLAVAPDHVRVTLTRSRGAESELDVTLTFGKLPSP